MSTPTLKQTIETTIRDAMKAKDSVRLGVLRQIMAAIKQVEVDNPDKRDAGLSDAECTAVLVKMQKQGRESLELFQKGGREELAQKTQAELDIFAEFLPKPFTEDEINALIKEAIAETKAESIKDMGKVMGILKPKLTGRADIAVVSKQIKSSFQ